MTRYIKVQYSKATAAAIINSGLPEDRMLTYHAFSDRMKAGILNMVASGNRNPIYLTICEGFPKVGEWYENLDPNSVRV